ncbi:MAG: tetratricopeptide repeat protein [Chloroflexi bacterium]|nr:tetratricopeptide repeat protein [Chloroflexota bacterium]
MNKQKRRKRPRRPSPSSEYRQGIREADKAISRNHIEIRPDNWQEIALDCFASAEPERGELARYIAANEKRLGVPWAREIVRLEVFLQTEEYMQIVDHYDRALSRYPRCALVEMQVADQVFRHAADFWRARRMYHHVIDALPDHPKPYYELGFMSYLLGDYGGALDCYNQAVERLSDDDVEIGARTFCNRGIVRYFLRGDKAAAIADVQEALKRMPDYPLAKDALSALRGEMRWITW